MLNKLGNQENVEMEFSGKDTSKRVPGKFVNEYTINGLSPGKCNEKTLIRNRKDGIWNIYFIWSTRCRLCVSPLVCLKKVYWIWIVDYTFKAHCCLWNLSSSDQSSPFFYFRYAGRRGDTHPVLQQFCNLLKMPNIFHTNGWNKQPTWKSNWSFTVHVSGSSLYFLQL